VLEKIRITNQEFEIKDMKFEDHASYQLHTCKVDELYFVLYPIEIR
jgi:hypothetical protein